jgi:hypothetical protein
VAYNLRRARQLKGWTQQETVDRLAPYLGTKIKRANYSLMESSHERDERIRNFTADDLIAFSACFDIPVLWFLLPPVESEEDAGIMVSGFDPMEYLDRVWPHLDLTRSIDPDPGTGALEKRLIALAPILGFDVTERVREAVTPQAAKALTAAMPTVLKLVRLIEDEAQNLQTFMSALKDHFAGHVVEPAWAKALEEASRPIEEGEAE